MMKNKTQVALIGYGNFGKLIVKTLREHCDVFVYDSNTKDIPHEKNVTMCGSIQELADKEYIILSVPMSALVGVLTVLKDCVSRGVTIIDVTSVKGKPIEAMLNILPESVDILGTHPLFGPKTSANGIKNKRISLFRIRSRKFNLIKKFIKNTLGLIVVEGISPDEHDRQMALVQALPHFIGHALQSLNLVEYEQSTATYHHLLSIADIVSIDTDELQNTIQNENIYAERIRQQFISAILGIERKIDELNARM